MTDALVGLHGLLLTNTLTPIQRELVEAARDELERQSDVADAAVLAEREDVASQPPKVKPLVWQEPCSENNWIYVARAPWGDYGIHIDGGRHRAWLESHVKPYEQWLGESDVGGVCEAQAAAQADHERRILAALDLPIRARTTQEGK